MRTLRSLPLAVALLGLAACHPLSCWYPAGLPTDAPKELWSSNASYPDGVVEVLFDDLGVPHFYAANEVDLGYGLGWAHGRDRIFQIAFRKHAAQGRLMELFGTESLLGADQHQRLLIWNLDEQFALLTERDLALAESYAAGVNDSYAEHGDSAEMALLGTTAGYAWEEFTAWDVLSIMRLLQDNQTGSIEDALAWERVFETLGRDHPLLDEIPTRIDAWGWPVITNDEFTGEPYPGDGQAVPRTARELAQLLPPGKYETASSHEPVHKPAPVLPRYLKNKLFGWPGQPGGASNSWAVSGEKTQSGNAMLANDPHMTHDQLWYLVHLEAPDFTIAGVSFAGLPVIVIGHSRKAAWGLTNPNVSSEELLSVELANGRDDAYMFDGDVVEFETFEQKYFIAGQDEPVLTETWQIHALGPMLPPGRQFLVDEGKQYVYKWTAHHYVDTPGFLSMWWDLGRAETADDVLDAASRHIAPPINMPFALTDGTIGWAVTGAIPQRFDDKPTGLLRDGTRSDGGWGDRIPFRYHPQTVNPAKGWLTATNQRLVEAGGPLDWHIGAKGEDGYRAERAAKQLTKMFAEGKPTTAQLGELQQDIYSGLAERLAPIFAEHCPRTLPGFDDALTEAFCEELRRFDFTYSTTSKGAIVFEWLWPEVLLAMATAHLGPDVAKKFSKTPYWNHAAVRGLMAFEEGETPLILDHPRTDEYDGPSYFVARGVTAALHRLRSEIGDNPDEWIWGSVHKYKITGALESSPVGFLFHTEEVLLDGCTDCLRAERAKPGEPVGFGPAMRLIVEMSDPIQGRIVTDMGQAEQFGHKHKQDQVPLWNNGTPPAIAIPRRAVEARLEGWARLNPSQ